MGLTECPICGDPCEKVNNHIHMASGGGHGEQHGYPEGYDKDTLTVGGSGDDGEHVESGDGSGGNIIATTGDGESGDSDATEAHGEARPFDIADQASEARTYNCSECGAAVGYLADFCGECDSSLVWGGVEGDDGDDDDGEHVEHDDDGETADMGADE